MINDNTPLTITIAQSPPIPLSSPVICVQGHRCPPEYQCLSFTYHLKMLFFHQSVHPCFFPRFIQSAMRSLIHLNCPYPLKCAFSSQTAQPASFGYITLDPFTILLRRMWTAGAHASPAQTLADPKGAFLLLCLLNHHQSTTIYYSQYCMLSFC